MKIKKLLAGVILMAGLILVSLPVSFASAPPITSPIVRPVTSQEYVNGSYITKFSVVVYRANYDFYVVPGLNYVLQNITLTSSSQLDFEYSGNRVWASGTFSLVQDNFDLLTGNYIGRFSSSSTINNWYPAKNNTTGIIPQVQGGYWNDQYIVDQTSYIKDYQFASCEPFVTWGTAVPDQTIYKSPLSEPIADKYNSYAVLDDHLIWISYRVNAMYTSDNQIETSSQVFSESTSVISSGNGSFTEVGNGYTEDVSLPDGEFLGASQSGSGGTTLYSGGYSGFDFGNIDFSTAGNGSVSFNSNGTVTYKDIEYKPISFSQSDILEYYRLYCIPTASDNFVFWLAPDHSFSNNILINMDFFFSEFDLDGNYIRSSFNQVISTELGLFDAYQPEDPVSSIRFYGIDFYNLNNLPLNLSSVLWQYDFDFETWRNQMFVKLSDIYNLLANAQDIPETTTFKDWHNELNEAESDFSDVSPDQVMHVLKNSFDSGDYGSAASRIRDWVNDFSIPEVITLCVFALALGTVTLTLGKKKSE